MALALPNVFFFLLFQTEEELQYIYLKGPVINIASTKKHISDESLIFKVFVCAYKRYFCVEYLIFVLLNNSRELITKKIVNLPIHEN